MAPRGRPSKFTDAVKEEILERLSKGETARAICRDSHMPDWTTLCRYKRKDEDFCNRYAQAKLEGIEVWADEINEIADDESRDYQADGKGGYKSDNTAVQRDRLRIDTKKWLMSKLAPKVYGDMLKQEISGKDGEKLSIIVTVSGHENNKA